jgi:transposase
MINLVGAMAEEGMIYYELLNEDGKKKSGTTSIDISNFLLFLQDHCPVGSIIVMDNARIHGGEDFERVCNLLKESTKKIKIEFLPKYSPFLNLIKLVFNIIKTDVKHKEIKSRSQLAQAIREAISNKMTPEICQKSFLHCQKFYANCTHMQPITGNIIKDPESFFHVS